MTVRYDFVLVPETLKVIDGEFQIVVVEGNQGDVASRTEKSEIIEIFGEPTVKSTFSDNVWYYITLVQHEKAYFEIKKLLSSKIFLVGK